MAIQSQFLTQNHSYNFSISYFFRVLVTTMLNYTTNIWNGYEILFHMSLPTDIQLRRPLKVNGLLQSTLCPTICTRKQLHQLPSIRIQLKPLRAHLCQYPIRKLLKTIRKSFCNNIDINFYVQSVVKSLTPQIHSLFICKWIW